MPDDPSDPEATEREHVEALLRLLSHEGKGRRPVLHFGCVIGLCILLGVLTMCGAGFAGSYAWIAIAFAIGFMWLTSRLSTSEAQRTALMRLASHSDLRIIGPLISAYYWPDMETHAGTIAETLTRLLPTMKASDAGVLNDKQRESLRRALHSDNVVFVSAILKALEQIGDERDIKVVQHLALRRAWTPRQKALKEAAAACLPALQAHLDQSGQKLLRVPDTNNERLLRPSVDSGGSDPEALLRPSPSNSEDEETD